MSSAQRFQPDPDPSMPLSPSQRFLLESAQGTYRRVAQLDFSQLSPIGSCLEATRLRTALGEVLGLVHELIDEPGHRNGDAGPG
jgi:hypothetical protein